MKSARIPLVLLAALAAGCGPKPKTDAEVLAQSRRILVSSCKGAGAKLGNVTAEQVDRFCACSAEKAIAILGPDGLRGLATRGQPSEDVQRQLKEAGVACVEQVR